MESMEYVPRALEPELRRQLGRRKSVLLLGPRQTGKTTLLARFPADLRVTFDLPDVRLRYERAPGQLLGEIAAGGGRRGPGTPWSCSTKFSACPPSWTSCMR
jgi:uncharacterized protein